MCWQMKFLASIKTRDIIFLAIIAACITLAGFLTKPLVMAIPIPGIRSLPSAFFYGLFMALGAQRVRKGGTIFLVALFNGLVLSMMSWIMLVNNIVAALLAELLILLFFRNYEKEKAILWGTGMYMVFTIPVSFAVAAWAGGAVLQQFLLNPLLVLPVILGTALLSFSGAFAGLKMGKELKKAGILTAS